jgi:hypothetical protein
VNGRRRYNRLQELKHAVSEQFSLPIESDRVAIIATLRLHHEQLTELMLAGKVVATSDLLSTARAIGDLSPLPPPPSPHVIVEYVEGPIESCPSCGWSRNLLPSTDTKIGSKPIPERSDISTAAPADVVTLRSIHDNAPLQRADQPWRQHL